MYACRYMPGNELTSFFTFSSYIIVYNWPYHHNRNGRNPYRSNASLKCTHSSGPVKTFTQKVVTKEIGDYRQEKHWENKTEKPVPIKRTENIYLFLLINDSDNQSLYIYIYIYTRLKIKLLELDFRAVKFLFFPHDRIWTHTIDTLQHHSLSLTSSALDHSTTSTPYIQSNLS